jgi:alkylation response protein AidB-like acyl-CoA dehydrogenase
MPAKERETMATAAQSGETPLTAEQIHANARALAPAIAERSEEIEALRRLPADLVAELRAAGFFRMGRSRAKGGPQMTLPQHLEVIEILAHADPSVGWCVKIGTDSGLLAELLPPAASARLLPHPDMITAGQFTTGHGKLERVDGGYLLNGRFPFGSGVTHADVVMSGGVIARDGQPVFGDNGLPEGRLAFCRADELVIEDTWHTHGLRGSGSTHYRAENLFVPEDQVLRIEQAMFADRAPLYSSGFNWVTTMAAVPLGTARRALDEARARVLARRAGTPPREMADLVQTREAIARAETAWGAAEAFLYRAAEEFWAELEAGTPRVETKGRLALANVNCFRMAADVTRQLFDLLGANVIFEGSLLERLARDALTLNQHMIIAQPALETYGAMMLGKEHPSPLY